ncbi:CLUMA_CG006835, isoform A [Clunio marinus]|uniref:CLUMA_CG006835, isoform A n=1 Tax=Clunio marinus TaxID=568069 RepID=A0A1J1I129_9DIPT|nr:CLUMA_CG006835, isoform A [Clunio marinus]
MENSFQSVLVIFQKSVAVLGSSTSKPEKEPKLIKSFFTFACGQEHCETWKSYDCYEPKLY